VEAFRAWVRESAALSMVQNTFKRNVLRSTTTPGTGQAAGADLRAQDSSTVRLDKNSFTDNKTSAMASARYGALSLSVQEAASATVQRSTYTSNSTESDVGDAIGTVLLSASRSSLRGARRRARQPRDLSEELRR
jgi:hypothetical protein